MNESLDKKIDNELPEVIYVNFLKRDDTDITLKFQKVDADRAIRIMSPEYGIYDRDGELISYTKLFQEAVYGTRRFVFDATDETSSDVVNVKKDLSGTAWFAIMALISAYVFTGRLVADPKHRGIFLVGTRKEVVEGRAKLRAKSKTTT